MHMKNRPWLLLCIISLLSIKSTAQPITVIGGTGNPLPSNVPAILSPMYPWGGAIDNNGNIFYIHSDGGYINTIRKINSNGLIETIGSVGLVHINDVFVYGDHVFLAMSYQILKMDVLSGAVSIVAGTGSAGFSGDGGLASNAQMNICASIYLDNSGNIFFSDQLNHRIRKISATSGIISTIAGTGIPGFAGDGERAVNAKLANPASIYADAAGNIYFYDSSNSRIRKIDATTQNIGTVTSLLFVGSLYVDDIGNIYFTEGSVRIRKIDSITGSVTTIAGNGESSFSGDGSLATNASMRDAAIIGIQNRELFFADIENHRIRKIGADGIINTIGGNGFVLYFGEGGVATNASFSAPGGLCLDTQGNIIFASPGDNCILKIDRNTGIISRIAGNGIDRSLINNPNNLALNVSLKHPVDVCIDKTGNLFIAEGWANRIIKVDAITGAYSVFANDIATYYNHGASGIWIDDQDNLFAAIYNDQRVIRIDAVTRTITTIAGTGVYGYNGDGILATNATFRQPVDVSGDAEGNLYIVDVHNYRIRRVDALTRKITTIAGNGVTSNLDIDGKLGLDASLTWPTSVYVDRNKKVFFTNWTTINRLDPKCKIIRSLLPDVKAKGLVYDPAGNMLLSAFNMSYGMILRVSISSHQTVTLDPIAAATYGNGSFSANAIATSGLPITSWKTNNAAVATIDQTTGLITPIAAGIATIYAAQSGNAQFLPAVDGCETLTVNKARLSIISNLQREYGEPNPNLTFGYNGFVNGDDVSDLDTPPAISTTATQSSDVGNYPISLSGGIDNNYSFPDVIGTLSITKVPLNIIAEDKTKQHGELNPAFTFSYSGFKLNDNASVINNAPDATSTALQFSSIGNYPITLSGGSDNNYDFIFSPGTLSITQRAVQIKVNDLTMVYGDTRPLFTFDITPGPAVFSITTQSPANSLSEPGTYPITITHTSVPDPNYTFSLVPGTVTITKAPLQAIADARVKKYGQPNPQLTLHYAGFKNGEGPEDIDVPPSIFTEADVLSTPGDYPITLTRGDDNHYEFLLANNILTIECNTAEDVFVPNVITPNGDGKNDVFQLSEGLAGAYVKVFNRWGKLVYEHSYYNNSWAAQGVGDGVYFFSIHSHGCRNELKGMLHILR
jgi:gliding motility-associated-like protein